MYLCIGEDVVIGRQVIAFDLSDVACCLDSVRSYFFDVLHLRNSDDFENYLACVIDGIEVSIGDFWKSVVSSKIIFCKIAAGDFMSDIYDLFEIFKLGWFTHREYSLELEKIFWKHFGQALFKEDEKGYIYGVNP